MYECLPMPNEVGIAWQMGCPTAMKNQSLNLGEGVSVEQKHFMECQSWSELRRASMVAKEILQRIIQGYLMHPLPHLPPN